MIPPRLLDVVVAGVAALVLLANLGGPALWDEDEPKNAACSAAMLDGGDWIVPTYNGRLRVEKPALVNWVQMAGFTIAGRNETGARLGSACLTIGTAILTARLAAAMLGPEAGLLAGLAMASCVWTAIGGRSATPDAPLLFFTTLGLACAVAARRACNDGRSATLPTVACGAALGAATLAKGPVGLCLPLAAVLLHAGWDAIDGDDATFAARLRDRLVRLRLPLLLGAAAIVALPWYVAVTLRTHGAWLEGFLLVHNIGRFAAPMEGHDGSTFLYYPFVLAVGFFPWSIVLAAVVAHALAVSCADRRAGEDARRRDGVRLMTCWVAAWVAAFSVAGTKLPGYVWPAYPALAALTGDFLASWIRGEARCTARCSDPALALERVMRVGWAVLVVAGVTLGAALVAAAPLGLPRLAALAPVGLLPVCAAVASWRLQDRRRRGAAVAVLAATSALTVTVLAGFGADAVGGARAARRLVAALDRRPGPGAWAGFGTVPPSVVFYAGDTIEQLHSTEAVAAHLASRSDAHLLVDARFEMNLPSPLPPGYAVVARETPLFGPGLLVIGPRGDRAVASPPVAHVPPLETPLAWHRPPRPE